MPRHSSNALFSTTCLLHRAIEPSPNAVEIESFFSEELHLRKTNCSSREIKKKRQWLKQLSCYLFWRSLVRFLFFSVCAIKQDFITQVPFNKKNTKNKKTRLVFFFLGRIVRNSFCLNAQKKKREPHRFFFSLHSDFHLNFLWSCFRLLISMYSVCDYSTGDMSTVTNKIFDNPIWIAKRRFAFQ